MLTASNAGKFKDRSPDLNAAGKLFSTVDDSISHLMKDSKRPQTPPEIHQWRNSAQSEPGKSVRHAGCFHDAYPDARLGRRNDYSETANGCLKVEKTHVQSLLEANREKIYLSSKIEPLGRSMTRDHQLPPITETRTFAFGVTSNKSENAKDVIYPIVKREEEVKNEVLLHQLYIRSHASYDPGEQKKRSYEWKQPNIDWSLHAFGRPCLSRKSHSDTVGFCLHPPTDQNQTWVVKKTDADFRDYVADHLGKSKHTVKSSVHTNHPGYPDTKNPCMTTKSVIEIRNKMSTPHMHPDNKNIPGITRTMSASHVSIASPEPGSVAEALHAGYDVGSLDDCGQQTSSLTRTCRRNLPEHLHKGVYHIRDMVHGMPTVRNDLKKPLFRKVTSAINYGDEPNAKQLLNPSVRTRGLTGEEDWNVPVEKEQLRTIVLSPQFGLSESTFQQCWEQVARQGKATVTYRTFFEQLKQQEKDVYL